jgi:hypothetical protein
MGNITPMTMTPEEWCKHYDQSEQRLTWMNGICERTYGSDAFPIKPLVGTMLKVHPEDCALLQPWEMEDGTRWVSISVHNMEHDHELKNEAELVAGAYRYYKYSLHTWPRDMRETLVRLFPNERVCDHTAFLVADAKGTDYSRTNLSHNEFTTLRENCPKEYEKYLEKYEPQAKKYADMIIQEEPHKEKPCIMYVAGCDDSSYTLLTARPNELLDMFESFKKTPLSYREIIDQYCFCFTN